MGKKTSLTEIPNTAAWEEHSRPNILCAAGTARAWDSPVWLIRSLDDLGKSLNPESQFMVKGRVTIKTTALPGSGG